MIHAAGVLRDALFLNQSAEAFGTVLAPKVRGAWELHRQTSGLPLDLFICFSSMSLAGRLSGANELRRRQCIPRRSGGHAAARRAFRR